MTTEPVRPTRMELIRKREQIRLAEQGRDLLREKMDALVREFFRVMNEVSASREQLEQSARIADRSLLIAQAVDDPVTLKSASFVTKRRVLLDIDTRSIMGVPIPVIEKKSLGLSVLERGYSIIGTSGRVDEVAEKFETEVDLIIELAETETTLRRIGHEILMTRRRVNALEQVMIPALYRETKYIKITIEEREREDLFRLKKVKRMIDRKKRQSRGVRGGEPTPSAPQM
ncbi:MAG TPA: V-type ATP synthase subunit D [Methanoregulaceae archaeon]|nr:V-type ATP synthase subunit D [Methanoregulaceae archaeon]